MKRWLIHVALAAGIWPSLAHAQVPAPPAQAEADEVEPPEEDEALKPKEYAFNPLQAEKEMKVGAFYFKRGSWRAAALRFEESTRWNPGLAEAWRRLGEAREKMEDPAGARTAYLKFLELAPEDKQAPAAKKKVAELAKQAARAERASQAAK